MRGAVIRCPNCGAAIDSPGNVVKCQYCGNQVRVIRRTGYFERVEPPPRFDPSALKLQLVKQAHSKVWIGWVVAMVMICLVGFAVPILLKVKGQLGGQTPGTHLAALDEPAWWGKRAIVSEHNGAEIIIGMTRIIRPDDNSYLAAFSLSSGERLWLSPPLGKYSGLASAQLVVAKEGVLIASGATLRSFSISDGTKRWSVDFPEKIDELCLADSGALVVQTADEAWSDLDLSDGSFAVSQAPSGCDALDSQKKPKNAEIISHGRRGIFPSYNSFENFRARNVLSLKLDGGAINLAVGHKEPGTSIPHLVRFTWSDEGGYLTELEQLNRAVIAATGSERTKLRKQIRKLEQLAKKRSPIEVWRTQVPQASPLKTADSSYDAEHVAANETAVAAVYEVDKPGGDQIRVCAFSIENGKRLFDVAIPADRPFSGVSISKRSVLVSIWGHLYAYSLSDGSLLFQL